MELKNEPQKRKEAILSLESYLQNPGRFSILILGNRGTGKTHWLRHLIEENNKAKREELTRADDKQVMKEAYHKIDAMLMPASPEAWEAEMKEAEVIGLLLIKDIEKMSKENQALLFNALYTTDGKFGLIEKKYTFRIAFTSTQSISMLRDTEKYLMHYFFDRIAQLVVKFPDFTESSNKIEDDFKSTWEKFKFETAYPNELIPWLKEHAHTLHGNFRDLDKLCIIWNNYQLLDANMAPEEILERVKDDFKTFYRFPEKKDENVCEIVFSKDKKWDTCLDDFRSQYKQWAKAQFGSLKKAGAELGISARTMEKW